MLREEFSFPIINNNSTTQLAAVTPSLWRISSLEEYPGGLDHQFEVNGRKGFSTRSFSEMVGDTNHKRDIIMHHGGLIEVEVQNKMDLLWEDFNDDDDEEEEEEEELGSKFSLDISGLDHQVWDEKDCDLEDARELLCMQANLKMSEAGTNSALVVSQKKTRMILVLKVLMKKLLLLHKMGRFKKCRS